MKYHFMKYSRVKSVLFGGGAFGTFTAWGAKGTDQYLRQTKIADKHLPSGRETEKINNFMMVYFSDFLFIN